MKRLFACLLALCLLPQFALGEAEEANNVPQVIVYFANWYLDTKPAAHGAEVISLPWDKIDCINHAFWKPAPAEGEEETSWARRAAGLPARTDFVLAPTDANADLLDETPSAIDPSLPRNHFAQYAAMKEKYPAVKVLISVGGWSDCGYFSEMAYTAEGRASFIQSCVALMEQYPFIDGMDIDWEYPAGSNDGERKPESDTDEGCPIWGTPYEDRANCTALFREMRETFDAVFGTGAKLITACVSASTGWTLPNQDWASAEPYIDRLNLMSYDLAGRWDGVTGFASTAASATRAFLALTDKGIPAGKISYGTPLYATVFKMNSFNPKKQVGVGIDRDYIVSGDAYTQDQLNAFAAEAVSGYAMNISDSGEVTLGAKFAGDGVGWHVDYDTFYKAPYLYNDDPDSPYYCWFISYENPVSLHKKLTALEKNGAAGLIVWEASQDTADFAMISQMHDWFHRGE